MHTERISADSDFMMFLIRECAPSQTHDKLARDLGETDKDYRHVAQICFLLRVCQTSPQITVVGAHASVSILSSLVSDLESDEE